MFDWNDEELTNIIWGGAGESADQIGSYSNQVEEKPALLYGDNVKKEANQQTSDASTDDQKKPTANPELGVDNTEKSETTDVTQGFGFSSMSDGVEPSSSNAAEDHSILRSSTLRSKAKSPMRASTLDETSQLNGDSEVLEKQSEYGEQGDFVDYSWANIGSFDDLDRIFSNNDDPIFGDLNVGNTDELWPTSKDEHSTLSGDSSDFRQRGLRTSTEESEINAQYVIDQNRPFISGYDTFNVSHTPRDAQTFTMGRKRQASSNKELAAACPNELSGKTSRPRPKKLPKHQTSDEKTEIRQVNNLTIGWPSAQYPPSMAGLHPPLMLAQQQKHFDGLPLATPPYGNVANPYSTPAIPQFHRMDVNSKLLLPRYEISPRNRNSVKNPIDCGVKPMTPEEKIEKLRRRQQIRAKLAIQKQQLQLVSEHSNMEGGGNVDVEDGLGSFHSLEPNSPLENCSVEESVLCRLQETIDRLDVGLRLCMRDSLFRLAQSAMLRQFPKDPSSPIRDEAPNKDNINHERFTNIPDIETNTNPIDRTVAHLLFHRPIEFSGKAADTPESPLSVNLSYERISRSSRSLAKGNFPENSENTQILSPMGSKTPALTCKDEQSKDASKNEKVDAGLTKDGSSI